MKNITFLELMAFMATPEAEALATTEEKVNAAQVLKDELDALQSEAVDSMQSMVSRLEGLKAERADWGKKWRDWQDEDKKDIRLERMAVLDDEIRELESAIAAG
jgi:Tfp pilus assembly protein FimT